MREKGSTNSPKSPSMTYRATDGLSEVPDATTTTTTITPIKQSSSFRNKAMNNNNNIYYDMPSVSDEMSTLAIGNSVMSHSSSSAAAAAEFKQLSSSNLSVNQLNETPPTNHQMMMMMMMNPSASSAPSTKSVSNFLLDYLLNNSKSGGSGFNSNNNLDASNLAALAALVDLGETATANENGTCAAHQQQSLNSPNDATTTSNNNTTTTTTNNFGNESMLKNLLIDLVSPPLLVSSQFDLSSAGSSVEHLELQLNYQVNNDANNMINNNNVLNARPQIDSASFNINLGSNTNNNMNSNNLTSKKQVNEQIMRACMGYLDYINKKHNRERRIQIIRNKVSGFVLLTIVFLLIFGLTLVMTFFLARAFTKMLKKASAVSSLGEPSVVFSGSDDAIELPFDDTSGVGGGGSGSGGSVVMIINPSSSTRSPFGLLSQDDGGGGVVRGMLQSETMVTASANNRAASRLNMTIEQQSIDQILRAMRQTLREMIKKTNLTSASLGKLSPYLTRVLNSTLAESIRNANAAGDKQIEVDNLEEEDTEEHYIELGLD